MEKIKIHFLYWFLLVITSVAVYLSQNWTRFVFPKTKGGIQLETDTLLVNPGSGAVIGILDKGTILLYPSLDEMNDCHFDGYTSGNHRRFKILVNLETSLLDKSKKVEHDKVFSNILILQEKRER